MTHDMLIAQAEWLPQYAEEIPAAKARLAAHDANGMRVKAMVGATAYENCGGDGDSQGRVSQKRAIRRQ